MDINVLIYLIVLLFGAFGFIFTALNRKRKINEDSFLRKAKYQIQVKDNDIFNSEKYKNVYFIMNISIGLIFLLLLIGSIIYLDGSIRDLTTSELELITILASLVATVFLLRINLMNHLKESFVTRHNNENKKHHELGYIMLNIAFLLAFIVNLIKYI